MSDTFTVHVPMAFQRRGGRKLIVAPDGTAMPAIAPRIQIDGVLVKALARAFRWQKLLDAGTYATIKEIAAKEKVDPSYVGDVLRLTLLAPDIIEMILDGRQQPSLRFEHLRNPFPLEWQKQADALRSKTGIRGCTTTAPRHYAKSSRNSEHGDTPVTNK